VNAGKFWEYHGVDFTASLHLKAAVAVSLLLNKNTHIVHFEASLK
jgi:hypothetical protein